MDDNVSIKSSDSVTTSGEYEIVPETPYDDCSTDLENVEHNKTTADHTIPDSGGEIVKKSQKIGTAIPAIAAAGTLQLTSPILNIANDGDLNDLEKNLSEVIYELDGNKMSAHDNNGAAPSKASLVLQGSDEIDSTTLTIPSTSDGVPQHQSIESTPPQQKHSQLAQHIMMIATATQQPIMTASSSDFNKVGQSIFYDCTDISSAAEKQDDMKPERSDTDEEMSDIDQDCTVFAGVTFLGAANINAPKSETEIHRKMSEMNSSLDTAGLKVSVSIPSCSEGLVVLYDATTNAVVSAYEVHRILFYARGALNSPDQACFAFTWSHGDSQESAIFQCHVFRCQIPEAVTQVSTCFAKAFHRVPQSLTGSVISSSAVDNNSIMLASITSDLTGNPLSSAEYEFTVSLEIREKVAKNSYQAVPRDRSCFRLRTNVDKEVCITVKQTLSDKLPPLFIERCFGVLLSPGKLIRQADMQLLDMVTMGYVNKSDSNTITATLPYQIIAEGKASDKAFGQLHLDSKFITVAVDLVIKGIQEPVRFVIETPVTILAGNETRFMDHFINKRSMTQRFYLQLKDNGEGTWEVNSIDPSEEIIETNQQSSSSSIIKLGINNLSKMVRSSSVASLVDDYSPTDISSDGDEPLLSGTGEVSKECPQESLDEWGPILQEWTNDRKRPKYLSHLVRQGIPETLRGKVWQKLANVENNSDMIEKYRVLLTKETACEPIILRDIHRTFPAHKFFREIGGSGQDALYKVSKAYAVYDSEVGYCQGLSFVAASLLLHMPEEEAFSVLVALMYSYGLRDLYKHGFESLYIRLYQLNRLMKDQLPKLYEHFDRTGVETHMFASQWFLTLFTARFPLYFVFHILDVFLLDGMPILFQVALTLLSACESDLRQLDFEGILKYFRVTLPKKCRNVSQARKLMKSACERKVKKLKQYEEEYLHTKRMGEKEQADLKEKEENEMRELESDRKRMSNEITKIQEEVVVLTAKDKMNKTIILDYKHIIQRQEHEITRLNDALDEVQKLVTHCQNCSSHIQPDSPLHKSLGSINDASISNSCSNRSMKEMPLGPLDPLHIAHQKIRELEIELAQTKLAKVEAECTNQDLNHKLNTTLSEIESNRSSWQPWFMKTINTIQDKVVTKQRDMPSFQSYVVAGPHEVGGVTGIGSPQQVKLRNDAAATNLKYKIPSYRNSAQRNSFDFSTTTAVSSHKNSNQHENKILKDSISCNSLK